MAVPNLALVMFDQGGGPNARVPTDADIAILFPQVVGTGVGGNPGDWSIKDALEVPIFDVGGAGLAGGALIALTGWNEANTAFTATLADADHPTLPAWGVVKETIAAGGTGLMIRCGTFTGYTKADAAAVDSELYLDTAAGEFTSTAPTGAGQIVQPVGYIRAKGGGGATIQTVQFYIQAPQVTGTGGIQDLSVTTGKIAVGALSADAAGRAKMANDYFDTATVADKFVEGSISGNSRSLEGVAAPAAGTDVRNSAAGATDLLFATHLDILAARLRVGTCLRIKAAGHFVTTAANLDQVVILQFDNGLVAPNGVLICQTPAAGEPANAGFWELEADVIIAAAGAGGNFNVAWKSTFDNDTPATDRNHGTAIATALNCTLAQIVQVRVQQEAGANQACHLDFFEVEIVN